MDINNLIQSSELRLLFNYFSQKADFNTHVFLDLYNDTNEETVIKILAHFNENLKESIKNLKTAMSEKNCEIVWKSSHKIAGSAELLGFKLLAEQARKLSTQIRANPVFEYYSVEINSYMLNASEINQQIENKFTTLKSFL